MLSDYDKDESGIVEFDEFLKIMTSKPCEDDTEHDIKKSFDFFDHDGKGYIT